MSKKVIVELTVAEAEALYSVADNTIGGAADQDDSLAVLGNMSSVRAGWRALEKLGNSIEKTKRVEPQKEG